MAKISVHCRDCESILGRPFTDVHKWLDEMNSVFPFQVFSDYHRSFRHNSYGIAILRDISIMHEIAGRIHLIRDYYHMLNRRDYINNMPEIIRKSNIVLVYFNNLEKFDVQIPHLFKDNDGLMEKASKGLRYG